MLTIATLTIDCDRPAALAAFWAALLGWPAASNEEGEHWITDPDRSPGQPPFEILFLPSLDTRTVKNRLHLDLRPDDQDADVARAISLGARTVDIGQDGTESWVVLADPEGNEFCILRALAASAL